jgi:broad specificity phosphatase PhoE
MVKSKQIGWLDRYADGGNISGPKVPPIKLNGTEVYEHGEDTATADHQENGVEPTDLTKKGVTYAKQIGKQAANQGKKTVISSDVERAVQTAGIMANESGMKHVTNPLLRTWDIGAYDGAPEGSFKEKDWIKDPNAAPTGGEPFNSFAQRMEQAYKMVKAAPKSDDIVTHSKVTRAFKALEATDGKWTNNTTKKFQSLKEETKAKDGLLLEKKADNYGKHGNYNDASVSTGPGFVGLGYDTTDRNYSPAWGGQFAMGGSLPGATGMMYARVGAPSNGKYAKKTQASAQDGYTLSRENIEKRLALEKDIKNQKARNAQPTLSQYTPKLGDQERMNAARDAYRAEEAKPLNRTASSKFAANAMENIIEPMANIEMAMGAGKLGKTAFNKIVDAEVLKTIPKEDIYTREIVRPHIDWADAVNRKNNPNFDARGYENNIKSDYVPPITGEGAPYIKKQNGGPIVDSMGQWAHPGQITTIPSNNITMQGVDYPVLGVSDTGDTKLMQPGKDYKFKGKKVTEYPQGGWLEKYKS